MEVLIVNNAVLLSDVHAFAQTLRDGGNGSRNLFVQLMYASSLSQVRSGNVAEAISSLELCVAGGSHDYTVCKTLLTLQVSSTH